MKYLVLTTEEDLPIGIIKNESDTDFSSIEKTMQCIEEYEDSEKVKITNIEGNIFDGIILHVSITCPEIEEEPTERKYFIHSTPIY